MTPAKKSVKDDKQTRVPYVVWRRARVCAFEVDMPLRQWIAEALVLKADLQEKAGRMSRNGARVAAVRSVTPTEGVGNGE